MSLQNKGRRRFLRGAGGIALALPLLQWDKTARAFFPGDRPQRMLNFIHPQGTLWGEWSPSGTGQNFDLSWILSPLEAHKSDLLVLSNISNTVNDLNMQAGSNGHNGPGRSLMTAQPYDENVVNGQHVNNVGNGAAAGPSIDQVMAERLAGETAFASAEFAIGGPDVGEYQMLWRAAGQPVGLEANPVAVFDKYFSMLDPDDQPQALETLQRLRLQRKSVLDAVDEGIVSLQSQLGAADRQVLEAHLTALRAAEMALTGGGGGMAGQSCEEPVLNLPGGYDPNNEGNNDVTSRVMLDLAVMALACDLTRVVTVQYTDYHGPNFQWLGAPIPGSYANWHEMVHTAGIDNEGLREGLRWYMDELGYLLDSMATTLDGDGRLLDSTMIYSVSEFQNGASHSSHDLPILLAGSACGAVPVGQHRDFGGRTTGDLYTTFLRWFGQDDSSFGWAPHCSGPIDALL